MDVFNLIQEYYQIPENICGGNLHAVLDDGNFDYDSIIEGYKQCKVNKDYLGMLICSLLMNFDEVEISRMMVATDSYKPEIMDMYYYD